MTEAVTYFADPANCVSYLVARRWPNRLTCPTCGNRAVYFDKTRMGWICKAKHPRRKFSLKTGTIFEDSPLGLDKWLPTIWMVANGKNGGSSWEIHRAIGVTQKTAWFMRHRIRLAMQGAAKPSGTVKAHGSSIRGMAEQLRRATAGRSRREEAGAGPSDH